MSDFPVDRDFSGQTVLITGGGDGIGKAAAEYFIGCGAMVAIVDINEQKLQDCADQLSGLGEVLSIWADVTSESDVENYVAVVVQAFSSIDIFFNNAGIEGSVGPVVDYSVDEFRNILDINVTGIFLGLKHVLRQMRQQGNGTIINSSSAAGLSGRPLSSAYSASKHAVAGLTKSAALEVASEGIRINSIHPALVQTGMAHRLTSQFSRLAGGMEIDAAGDIPMGRVGTPQDVVAAVAFLASNESNWMTGAGISIDGGRSAQ